MWVPVPAPHSAPASLMTTIMTIMIPKRSTLFPSGILGVFLFVLLFYFVGIGVQLNGGNGFRILMFLDLGKVI